MLKLAYSLELVGIKSSNNSVIKKSLVEYKKILEMQAPRDLHVFAAKRYARLEHTNGKFPR